MINLKRLFNTALMVSCIASLNASSHVCSVNPASLTIIGGAHILYPVHSESKIWGIGGGLDLYVSRANKFGMHAAGQIAYMSDGDFD
ncbi:MAG: hypothetical protein KAH32_03905, partial [Chlamydiia bacterium]|nr:hypothetical protein [Chlamydiia bacterium]